MRIHSSSGIDPTEAIYSRWHYDVNIDGPEILVTFGDGNYAPLLILTQRECTALRRALIQAETNAQLDRYQDEECGFWVGTGEMVGE